MLLSGFSFDLCYSMVFPCWRALLSHWELVWNSSKPLFSVVTLLFVPQVCRTHRRWEEMWKHKFSLKEKAICFGRFWKESLHSHGLKMTSIKTAPFRQALWLLSANTGWPALLAFPICDILKSSTTALWLYNLLLNYMLLLPNLCFVTTLISSPQCTIVKELSTI